MRIDDALLRELKELAQREGLSLTKLLNRVLRHGMSGLKDEGKASRPYREKTFSIGPPSVNLDKALMLAASLEDDEVREKLDRRK